MFVDASAMVAILTGETDADALADALESARSPVTSAVAVFEAVLGLRRKRHSGVAEAQEDVREFLETAGVRIVPIGVGEAAIALDGFARYGKGEGHPAQLNLGDCFAYACGDYIARLEQAGIQPSMSRPGCPWDNAMAESFMRTLKREEVNGLAYLAPEAFEAGRSPVSLAARAEAVAPASSDSLHL